VKATRCFFAVAEARHPKKLVMGKLKFHIRGIFNRTGQFKLIAVLASGLILSEGLLIASTSPKRTPLPQSLPGLSQPLPMAPDDGSSLNPLPIVIQPLEIQVDLTQNGRSINGVTWTPIGPYPIPNGQTQNRTDPVSGRVTAIVVHPVNSNIVYVGTAQGGVYRTLDGGANWTPLMDAAQSLAIGALSLDPINPSTLFVGTGEGNLSGDSYFGVGLYRIVNADTAPTMQGPFETRNNGGNGHAFVGTCATRIIVDPNNNNNMFVAVTFGVGGVSGNVICCGGSAPVSGYIGLFFCSNAQAATPTFALVNPASLPGNGFAAVTDIAIEPGNANTLILSQEDFNSGSPGSGIYRSTNALSGAGATYVRTLSYSGSRFNVKFAINKIGTAVTVLAATEESSGTLRKSIDGGASWPTILGGSPGFCDGQCWYDLVVAMPPNDTNTVYLAGSAHSGSAHILLKSINGGAGFTDIDTGLHADSHAFAFDPSNLSTLYFGSDGGIWKSVNAGSSWTSLNNTNFSATQFESLALHPTDRNFMIGGTQDNGTPMMNPDGTWVRADFGDGGFALIDQSSPDTTNVTMYHTYFNRTGSLIGFGRVTNIASAHDGGWSGLGAGLVADPDDPDGGDQATPNGIGINDTVLFYAPMALGPGTPNTVYFGSDRLYRSVDRGATMTIVSQAPFVSGVPVSAIGISAQNDNVRIVGLSNGKVFATTAGSSVLTDVTGSIPAKYISRAVIDPNNANTAYVTISGFGLSTGQHVWKTTNLSGGGGTWVASGNGIPDIPVNGFAIDPRNSSHLYAGTDAGVYASFDGGSTWAIYGSGLPHVAVFNVAIQDSFRVLRAATHGRGIWEILPALTPDLAVSKTATSGTVTLGNNVTYTLSITNSAAVSASSVTITDALPAGLSFVSASPNCTNIGGVIVCGLGTITNNDSALVSIVATVTNAGFITNTATVSSSTLESNLLNNSSSLIISGIASVPAQLVVTPTGIDFGLVATGISAQASMVVSNAGGATLNGSAAIDPGSFAILSGSPYVVAAATSTNVVVSFTPPAEGVFSNVIVFSSNGGSSTNTVVGRAINPPLISEPAISGTDFTFTFPTIAGFTYVVQYEDVITAANWQTLQIVPGDGTVKTVTVPVSAPAERYFRLLVQ
jgi:uncharacterized repeat protein (TIGR01451 family)